MAMMSVCLCSLALALALALHVWNGAVLAMDKQEVRLCRDSVLEFEGVWLMQYAVRCCKTSTSCSVQIHCNGDAYVRPMNL